MANFFTVRREPSQYRVAWDAENAGGYAPLLTITLLDADQRKILLDTGWSNDWMDYVFARRGVDRMLAQGEIDFMVLSHWHLDHFWGIEDRVDAQAQSADQARGARHLRARKVALCCKKKRILARSYE